MSDPGARAAPSHRALRIGLTGPIGCGKSTVAGWLAELGAVVIDADRVARDVTEPGGPAFAGVVDAFGPAILGPDGAIDRAALARRVFADPTELRRLEAIVHPAVRPIILASIAQADMAGAPAVVIEAIKLVEGGLADQCDEIWLVDCAPSVQRDRLAERGMAFDEADRRIGTQTGIRERVRPIATEVLDTSGDIPATIELTTRCLERALGRHRGPVGRSRA